ncbi:MAG: phosphoribosylanthranilate isomerase [Chloroflexi bacterium]|nr:MAG: phosphoribosylanthranilate isomerase [Chloroflexota bacterium]
MVQVKICGICDLASAQAAVDAGADLLGFHFCDSSRRIAPEEARSIVEALDARPAIAGVFIEVAELVGLDLLQLHGSEPPGFDAGRPVMKVLKVRAAEMPDASRWPDPIMLDSWSHDQRGGTGRTWTWELARDLLSERKVFIAGGLEPGNVGTVVRNYRPYGVDVSSGVESRVRVKDPEKIRAFIQAVRLAEQSS